MKFNKTVIYLFILISFSCNTVNFEKMNIDEITVSDFNNKFDSKYLIKITDKETINEFKKFLINSEPADSTLTHFWTYRIDIKTDKSDYRWYYDSKNGFLALLNYQMSPCIKLKDFEHFELYLNRICKNN